MKSGCLPLELWVHTFPNSTVQFPSYEPTSPLCLRDVHRPDSVHPPLPLRNLTSKSFPRPHRPVRPPRRGLVETVARPQDESVPKWYVYVVYVWSDSPVHIGTFGTPFRGDDAVQEVEARTARGTRVSGFSLFSPVLYKPLVYVLRF